MFEFFCPNSALIMLTWAEKQGCGTMLEFPTQIPLIWVDNSAQNRRSVLSGRNLDDISVHHLSRIATSFLVVLHEKNGCFSHVMISTTLNK